LICSQWLLHGYRALSAKPRDFFGLVPNGFSMTRGLSRKPRHVFDFFPMVSPRLQGSLGDAERIFSVVSPMAQTPDSQLLFTIVGGINKNSAHRSCLRIARWVM
jgi:hypothetical protein